MARAPLVTGGPEPGGAACRGAPVSAGGCRPYPAGLPSLQVTDVLSKRCSRKSSLSC